MHPRADRPVRAAALRLRRPSLRRGQGRREPAKTDRYGRLLLLLVVGYTLSAITPDALVAIARLVLFVITLVLALRTSRTGHRTTVVITTIAIIGTVVSSALVLVGRSRLGSAALDAWMTLVLLIVVLVIVRRVLSHRIVTVQTILGAVSAYLIIGMMFAACYGVINDLTPSGFFGGGEVARVNTLQYFSFTTLTTLGFGDYTAGTNTGQAVTVMEALVGQIFLATLVARLVSGFQPRRARDGGDSATTTTKTAGARGGRSPARRDRHNRTT
jgi:hypothetical protein